MSTGQNSPAMFAPSPIRAARRFVPRPPRFAFTAVAARTAFAAAALGGCAIAPVPEPALPEIAVPTAWSGAERPQSAPQSVSSPLELAAWWRRFDDPQLDALIERTLAANTSVGIARASLQQARAVRDVQSSGLLPRIDGSGSADRSRLGGAGTSNRFQAGLDAGWELDLFGATRSAVDAAEADVRAAGARLADVHVSLAAETALAYIDLRGLQSRLAIARQNLALQSETLQIARWRAQAGLVSSTDVEQARAESERTAAQIPALEIQLNQTLHGLAVLTGQPPGALHAELASVRPVPQAGDALALGIPAETLRQRADVRAAEHQVAAALSRVAQADALRYPSFRIGGSLGLSALTLGGLASSGATTVSSLLAAVSVPLFDAGAARAQVRVQGAAFEQARLGYRAVVLDALREVEDSLVALRGNRERLARLQNAAEAASNAALLAQDSYTSGLIDFQVVLDTQRALLSTQDGVASTVAGVSADHVRLYKALGGGWQNDEPAAAPAERPRTTSTSQSTP